MKEVYHIKKVLYLLATTITIVSCDDSDSSSSQLGTVELKFDNVVGEVAAGIISNQYSEEYPFTNSNGQMYNLTLVKYIVSEIAFEGPDGAHYADVLDITGDEVNGYYLVDDSDLKSQRIEIGGVTPGTYNQVTFKIGIEEEGISQGASIILDGMFWVWNTGYIGMKIEGQSPDSPGDSFGDTIDETNPYGFGYHIGGWKSPNNVRSITVEIDDFLVSSSFKPEVHLVVDVQNFMNGDMPIDFSAKNSVHSPSSGEPYADNLLDMFAFDHVHNNAL
ncbi:MAG: hypothetical protein OCD76_14190 [Reichenbachiella sp.]